MPCAGKDGRVVYAYAEGLPLVVCAPLSLYLGIGTREKIRR